MANDLNLRIRQRFLNLIETVAVGAKSDCAPTIRRTIIEVKNSLEELVGLWRTLASYEYATDRLFRVHGEKTGFVSKESLLAAILENKPLPKCVPLLQFYDLRQEFLNACHVKDLGDLE